ncbi:MAG: LysR family transcriptional regulator [Deltaproteobacteria bacterium]|nr:LysR family transcriptional regulator [Deltaproteobacteria bacterium]
MIALENLSRMAVFAAVIEENGFSAAARRLGLTRSAVSRQIAQLEQAMGARLLHRTTRRLQLTEVGERFFASCQRIVGEAENAERQLQRLQAQPTGLLRITAPVIADRILIETLRVFLARYPQIEVDLVLDEQYLDLVQERFDLALRIGHPHDSSLITRRLAPIDQVVCGSPSYFAARGRPAAPDALSRHDWLVYSLFASPRRFTFSDAQGTIRTVRVNGRLRANNGPALRRALLAGLGITLIPRFFVAEDLARNRLQTVLDDYSCRSTALYSVYPHRDHLPSKVRLFLTVLTECLPRVLGTAPSDKTT